MKNAHILRKESKYVDEGDNSKSSQYIIVVISLFI